MTPESKAKELLGVFYEAINDGIVGPGKGYAAKQCALITVDEIIHCTWKLKTYKKNGYIAVAEEKTTEYWQQVKQAIEKM